MNFEWDEKKATINQRKHGVSFEVAARVFLDPNRIEAYDDCEEYGEDRWKTVGMVDPVVLAVVYAVRGPAGQVIRLISARKANEKERRQYRQVCA
ncbi:MAG: BrnT family toxin [Syntrophobacteraceae bacterium]